MRSKNRSPKSDTLHGPVKERVIIQTRTYHLCKAGILVFEEYLQNLFIKLQNLLKSLP